MYKNYSEKIPPDDVEKLVNFLLTLEAESLPSENDTGGDGTSDGGNDGTSDVQEEKG